jgi:hypothetical protein
MSAAYKEHIELGHEAVRWSVVCAVVRDDQLNRVTPVSASHTCVSVSFRGAASAAVAGHSLTFWGAASAAVAGAIGHRS